MSILKKPYEISIWDDRLVWYRRKLIKEALLKKEDYLPGKYYSAIENNAGAATYNLDTEPWSEAKTYYSLAKLDTGNYLENSNVELLEINPIKNPDWYTFALTQDEIENSKKQYYVKKEDGAYESATGTFNKNTWYEATAVPQVIISFYKEVLLCVIGSDTMTAPWRAVNPTFVKNVNGSSTLTFTMYSKYYDEDKDELLDNPFVKKMVNERKVKLKYDGEWYDFIIKNIEESSDNKTYTYTAKDLFINELSKTGYDLVFDSELENNLGTIDELADEILKGSDWTRRKGDTIRQYKEEPLYKITVETGFTAYRMLELENEIGDNKITLKAGDTIYGFYQCVNSNASFFQFLYKADGKYETDDDRVIINIPNYYVSDAINPDGSFKYFDKDKSVVTDKYRGKRLVRNIITKYDPVMDKYVNVYTNKAGETIYGYTEYEYLTSNTVRNYITNPTAYTSTDGWSASAGNEVKLMTDPPLNKGTVDTNFKTYLKWHSTNYLINSCITENRSIIKNFSKGEEYTVRIKYGYLNNKEAIVGTEIGSSLKGGLNLYIAEYKLEDGNYSIVENDKKEENILFTFEHKFFKEDSEGYRYYTASCEKSVSYDDLLNHKYGLLIEEAGLSSRIYCIEDIQLFKCTKDSNGNIIYPNTNIESETKIKYIYYKYNPDIKDPNLIQPIYQGYTEATEYTACYDENCEKRRSIKASESNRFNLIQSLCETFECWAKFEIEHNENTGEILIDETNGRQKKWVSFHEYIGDENHIGFKYGINLKSIRRTIDSESIATKLIVKNNSNEYADGGFCSIATASENPTGENFLLDFTHYINQGLLNFSQFNNDLYLDTTGYLGYYKKLRKANQEIEENAKLQAELVSKTLPTLRSQYSTYKVAIESGEEQYKDQKDRIQQATHLTLEQLLSNKDSNWWQDDGIYSLILSTIRLDKNIEEYKKLFEVVKNSLYGENWKEDGTGELGGAEGKLKELEDKIDKLVEEKKTYHQEFYQKYSRYIQEGSWISEDYIDDNLYYLDAESTLHTSSQPKVTYTINVLELSQVEGFEYYQFNVGDKTFIEDTEFFGWVDQIHSTPYKEEVAVSEVKVALDDPTQNTITVKNYKTQFEDLFQRITATTTSVQFSTGEYQRAAGVVEADGSLSASAVQNSIFNNSIILSNSNNESVIWDETGITTTSINKPNEMVRIVGGGIFLSKDFGTSWSTGITGSGINANFINAGQIDTNLVRIMNGSYPTFRWDSSGLSAYYFYEDEKGVTNYSQSKFVRLDQFGLYGINSDSAFNVFTPDIDGLVGEDKIKKHSHFYLTWSGFGIKTESGAVSITYENDIEVKDSYNNTKVKIGSLGGGLFGMRLFDNSGNTTLETGGEGQLYLKKTIKIGPSVYDPRVILGPSVTYIEKDEEGNEKRTYSKIFSVKNTSDDYDTIAFYDNGLLEAKNAVIRGTLEAGSILSNECEIGTGGFKIDGDGNLIANVDDARLSFSPEGLKIKNSENGGISIYHLQLEENFVQTEDTTVNENKIYYILENGNFIEVLEPIDLEIGYYYEKITEQKEYRVFEANTNGEGYFSGKIEADSGKIGDIALEDGRLFYKNGDNELFSLGSDGIIANSGKLGTLEVTGKITSSKKTDGKNEFTINGEDGSIVANNITLGSAHLSEYLRIGNNCWIFNPEAYNKLSEDIKDDSNWRENSFINVNYNNNGILKTAVSITKDGYIKLSSDENDNASIILDGQAGAIYSANQGSGSSWRIDNDSAVFNNITARGSLKCAVLEYGEVQSVGGILLIRPSSIIKDYTMTKIENPSDEEGPYKYSLTLENAEQFVDNEYCNIQVSEGKKYTVKVKKENNNIVFFKDTEISEDLKGASIISFGSRTSAQDDEDVSSYGIGLNASSNNDSLVPKRALSLVNFYYDSSSNSILSQNKIILGYIPENSQQLYGSISGQYGLYADNVLVKGKLISGVGNDNYVSGIDSLSSVSIPDGIAAYFEESKRNGNIIFWAGAPVTTTGTIDIQSSPFWVDSYGNMYAGSGYFKGAIITESTITAAEIKTAVITGTNDGDYALKIRNDFNNSNPKPKAIKFFSSKIIEDEKGEKKVEETDYFTLSSEELRIGADTSMVIGDTISLNKDNIISPQFRTGEVDDSKSTIVTNSKIGFLNGAVGLQVSEGTEGNILSLENGGQYITLNNNIVSIIKRLSIENEFNLWNIQFKKVQNESGSIIGFDIEIED